MDAFHASISPLRDFIAANRRLVVITGAGVSVSSGIPTYRDRDGVWRHSTPITHQEFVADAARRRRYWARSLLGWPAVRDARPNQAHLALARLEHLGHVDMLITQNVDRLHQRAGSVAVIDLHGRVDQVRCLHCNRVVARELVQQQLLRANPQRPDLPAQRRPDGDADVADEWVESIAVPDCGECGGTLIPDVVFFGGTVPRERVQACRDAVAGADGVLAVGSSLQVFSGFRFCRLASELGKPIAIINPGKTRADPLADVKLQADCGPLLEALAAEASSTPPSCAAGSPR
jgi:NAD-dependent SIR2 family protein deacetylase